MVAVDWTKAPRPVWIEIELRRAGGDELCKGLADSASAAKTVEREPGRQVETPHAGNRTHEWIGVRRHGVGVADELYDSGLAHEREAAGGAGQERLEPCLVGRQRGAGMVPGNAVDPACHRIRLVAAEDDAARL